VLNNIYNIVDKHGGVIMLKFDFTDEELTSAIRNMISCMLPHDNYEYVLFSDILDSLQSLIKVEELPVEYSIIVKIFNDLNKIKIPIENYSPRLTRERLEEILTSSLESFITENSRQVEDWMRVVSGECNLKIPEQFEHAMVTIYNEAITLYDDCMELGISGKELPMLQLRLVEAFKANVTAESIKTQAEMLNSPIWIGRKRYNGYQGVINYTKELNMEIDERLRFGEDENLLILDDISKSIKLDRESSKQSTVISNWGIPELDDITPVLAYRYVVIAGNPGAGKTLLSCNYAGKLLSEKKKVVYMCGEFAKNKIYNMIRSNYIYRTTGKYVSSAQMSGMEEITEEQRKLVNIASIELTNLGLLTIRDSYHYENAKQELINDYEKLKFDVVFIDHSAALESLPNSRLRSMKEKIDEATLQIRDFKKKYPVSVIELSHLSTTGSDDLVRHGKVVRDGVTRDTAIFEKETDELFIIYKTDLMEKQNLLGVQIFKRRDKSAPRNHIILSVKPNIAYYEYNKELQMTNEEIGRESALDKITNQIDGYNEDEFGEDIEMSLLEED
jgi:hypothetical protein